MKALRFHFCNQLVRLEPGDAKRGFSRTFIYADHVALGLPDYPKIVKKPMDISKVKSKLESGQYSTADAFAADFRLMLRNCFAYNPIGTAVHEMGKKLEHIFNLKWRELPDEPEPESDEDPESEEETCVLPRRLWHVFSAR